MWYEWCTRTADKVQFKLILGRSSLILRLTRKAFAQKTIERVTIE